MEWFADLTNLVLYISLFVVGLVLGSGIHAIFARLGTRIVAGFSPAYRTAYLATLLVGTVNTVCGFFLGTFLGAKTTLVLIVGPLLGLAISAVGYGTIFEESPHESIGIIKGGLVSVLAALMAAALVGLVIAVAHFGSI